MASIKTKYLPDSFDRLRSARANNQNPIEDVTVNTQRNRTLSFSMESFTIFFQPRNLLPSKVDALALFDGFYWYSVHFSFTFVHVLCITNVVQ
jgi:hypothetical protein